VFGRTTCRHVGESACRRVGVSALPVLPALAARKSVLEGHLIVAHYEVVGKALKIAPSRRGRSNTRFLARIRPRDFKQPVDRPLRDGSLLKKRDPPLRKRDPPLRSGLLSNVPSSFAPPPLRCGAAFVLRATADGPGRGPLRMLVSLMLTRLTRVGVRLGHSDIMRRAL
jgi:hypothetical protein